MPLTRSFRETVQARAKRDPAFREALFQGAVQTLLEGDTDTGRAAMRNYITATIGFERLSIALGRSQKSLMRMFGPGGNPTAENLFRVISVLQSETVVRLEVRAVADNRRKAALDRMASRKWTLPPDYKFDRDEANER